MPSHSWHYSRYGSIVHHQNSRSAIRLGFVPLNDCAPIAVAKELGLFNTYGVSVTLSRQPGWATIRDMLFYGELDASQGVAGIAFNLSPKLEKLGRSISVPLILSAHGNAVTLSNDLPAEEIGNGSGLARYLHSNWRKNRPPTFAAAYHYSSHHILLHSWLRSHGLEPKRDVEIIFLPPPLMPDTLAAGHIDGYCVGEPWNSEAILGNIGWSPATSSEISSNHPEKILAVSGNMVTDRRQDVIALTAALLHACRLCQETDFRKELISILARPEYTGCSKSILFNSLGPVFKTGRGDLDATSFHLFFGENLNQPSTDKASWFLSGMRNAGLLPDITLPPLTRIYREDLFQAAKQNLLPCDSTPA